MVAFLICERCGSVGEIPAAPVAQSLNAAARCLFGQIVGVEITGTCAHCKSKTKVKPRVKLIGHDLSQNRNATLRSRGRSGRIMPRYNTAIAVTEGHVIPYMPIDPARRPVSPGQSG